MAQNPGKQGLPLPVATSWNICLWRQ